MQIKTLEETRAYMRHRFASRKWWLVAAVDDTSRAVMSEIEKRYYSKTPAARRCCELMILPAPIGVMWFKKSRMSPEQLHALLSEWGGNIPDVELMYEKDVLCPTEDMDLQKATYTILTALIS